MDIGCPLQNDPIYLLFSAGNNHLVMNRNQMQSPFHGPSYFLTGNESSKYNMLYPLLYLNWYEIYPTKEMYLPGQLSIFHLYLPAVANIQCLNSVGKQCLFLFRKQGVNYFVRLF